MYRLVSVGARYRILTRIFAQHELPFSGCWLRVHGKWLWRSQGAATQPSADGFCHWKSLGVRVAGSTGADSERRKEVRVKYGRALVHQARKSLLRGWVQSLLCQRKSLAAQLHGGLCQLAMVLDLQSHWLKNCPPSQRADAEKELLESISALTSQFSQFFQEQLASGGGGTWGSGSSFGNLSLAGQFCRELVLTSRALDRHVEIEDSPHRMTLRFTCTQEKRSALTPLLEGLKLSGVGVAVGAEEVALSLF